MAAMIAPRERGRYNGYLGATFAVATVSGPLIGGLFAASTLSGRVITGTGRWKRWLVAGGVLVSAGTGLLGTVRYDTPYWQVAVFMALMGLGIGMTMQNLVLAAQNQAGPKDLGAASSLVALFRSLGGAVGVSGPGRPPGPSRGPLHRGRPGPAARGAAHRRQSAYGHGVADVFLCTAPAALLALVLSLFVREAALRTTTGAEARRGE